jgi:hypothetical protein
MPAGCVLHTSLAEFCISADKDSVMLRGPHCQFVISCARQAGRTCCPAFMATLPQRLSHRSVHVVIEQEAH